MDVVWKTAMLGAVVTATAALGARRSEAEVVFVAEALERSVPVAAPSATPGRALRLRAEVVDPSPECRAALTSGARRLSEARADGLDVRELEREWLAGARDVCAVRAAHAGAGPETGRWPGRLLALWALGATLALAGLGVRIFSLRTLRTGLEPAAERSQALLAGVIASARSRRRPRLVVSDRVDSPCVVPGTTIVLSMRCESELTDDELRAVLAHEYAHIARRDVTWLAVLRALSLLFWLQPLNRLALREASQAAELACDDWAVARTGGRHGLASSIARVAEWSAPSSALRPGIAMVGRGREGLSERVRRILAPRGRPDPRWLRLVLASLLIVPMYWLPAVELPIGADSAFYIEAEPVIEGIGRPEGDSTAHEAFRWTGERVQATVVVARRIES